MKAFKDQYNNEEIKHVFKVLSEKIDLTCEFLNVSKVRTQLARVKEEAAIAREAACKAKKERFSIETCLKLLNKTLIDKNSFEYMTAR